MLRRWLKRAGSADIAVNANPAAPTDDLRALREVYLNLFDVQRSHALIDVAIDGVDAHYQSIILGVDPERGTISIDELFPAGFVGLPGQPVTVTVRLDGSRRLTFNTHIVARRDVLITTSAAARFVCNWGPAGRWFQSFAAPINSIALRVCAICHPQVFGSSYNSRYH
jgi:hypothetical protein